MDLIATPHIKAYRGDFAKTVLMPGDPKRARFVAEKFLDDAHLVNDIRGVQGYTGSYNGKQISVMASGMGIPSIAIYSHELFTSFGVENIIRIGSAGALADDLKLGNVVIAMSASTNSSFLSQYNLSGTFAPTADYTLMKEAIRRAEEYGIPYSVGNVLSSDIFYSDMQEQLKWKSMGVLAVEMEAAGLYATAAALGKRALAILSISDHIITGEALDAEQRQIGFSDMIQIALGTAAGL